MLIAPLPRVLTFHLQVVRLRNVEQVVSVCNFKLVRLSLLVYDCDMTPECAMVSLTLACEPKETYSSPAFGVPRCPCCVEVDVENDRAGLIVRLYGELRRDCVLEVLQAVVRGLDCHLRVATGRHERHRSVELARKRVEAANRGANNRADMTQNEGFGERESRLRLRTGV